MGCVIPFSVTTPRAPTVLQLGQSPPGTNLEFGSPGFSSSTWQHAGACSSTQEQTMLPLGNVVGVGQFVQVPAHVSVALSPVPLPVPEHRPSCGVAKAPFRRNAKTAAMITARCECVLSTFFIRCSLPQHWASSTSSAPKSKPPGVTVSSSFEAESGQTHAGPSRRIYPPPRGPVNGVREAWSLSFAAPRACYPTFARACTNE